MSESLPQSFLECLRSEDEKVRIAGALEYFYQAEALARTVWLAQGQMKSILEEVGAGSELMKDFYATLRMSQNLSVWLGNECAALAPHLNKPIRREQEGRSPVH